jgi:hypothetical protein
LLSPTGTSVAAGDTTVAAATADAAVTASSFRHPSPLALLSETAVSPPVSDGLSGSAVIRDINHLLRETVIPETQVAQEMQYDVLQHDVVDDT